jgi:hypothetical protein
MPIHHMLYRCPRCGHDPLSGHKGRAECLACGTKFERGRGAIIVVRPPGGPPEETSANHLLLALKNLGGPSLVTDKHGESLFREAKIALGRVEGHDVIRSRGEVLGFSEKTSWKGTGLLKLDGGTLSFKPDEGTEICFCSLDDIRGVQISSRAVQITLEGSRMHQFEFLEDSPRRWEQLLCLSLERFHADRGETIVEFKPRLVTTRDG